MWHMFGLCIVPLQFMKISDTTSSTLRCPKGEVLLNLKPDIPPPYQPPTFPYFVSVVSPFCFIPVN